MSATIYFSGSITGGRDLRAGHANARYRCAIPLICLYRPAFTSRCSAMVAGHRSVQMIKDSDAGMDEAVVKLLSAVAQ